MRPSADFDKIGSAIVGRFGRSTVHFRAARITEELSTIPEIRAEFLTTDREFNTEILLGTRMRLLMKTDFGVRKFQGICISVEYLGSSEGFALYAVEIRPWLWFLTRSSDTRIFQGKSTIEIIQDVCNDLGFSDHRTRLSGSYGAREYCVQYNETDFDFVSRLMEGEGITYYFDYSGESEEMILADGIGAHDMLPGGGALPFRAFDRNSRIESPHVFEWSRKGRIVSGKISLVDYDMKKPNTDLKVSSSIKKGIHSHGTYERYEVNSSYSQIQAGEKAARIRMEREAHQAERFLCAANAAWLGAGFIFTLINAPSIKENGKYLVLSATHHLRSTGGPGADIEMLSPAVSAPLSHPNESGHYVCTMEVARSTEPFRPARKTASPLITGVLTAVVTGPSGEEIYTDEYGRIKVQFHWDREGQNDENTTCWVRTVVPWSGRGWGMFAIPRIGQEVVVEFERGNPNRPLVTGMVYNAATKPPHDFPANATMSGLRTNSSKGGGGFHELVFEDLKDEEYVRMISEKDYFLNIKNNAEVTIGMDKQDPGDLTQTIHRHKTETLKTGDYTFSIEDGNRKVRIAKNHAESIGGKSDTKITGDTTQTITQGDFTATVEMGNHATDVDMGNISTKAGMGNISINADLGKIDMEAMQSITLKVGGNSIKIDQVGVTIKGMMVKIEGTAMLSAKAPMSDIKGDAILILKGGLTVIN
ncbi:type VI secretion system tip protein VgrG [Rhodobacteraceae bacterium 2376]|uniref:Type VI secretion system tip protein VgrG n=1 Tax=Rhabdonatronobacter sediminivivens TaxID=2743469 RepID=A0A7Z0I0G9_9RHOB|nr:type VI secretion system tip protein TssI/VgrG [Rhabdonatronobacter sediminivivens]NYS25638.1 type VI secretion system tip protein VgrG [Rhabdonatronobacter sediminivivens]